MALRDTALIMLSGGQDSSAALLKYRSDGKAVRGVFFDVGQRSAPRQKAIIMQQSWILGVPVDYI